MEKESNSSVPQTKRQHLRVLAFVLLVAGFTLLVWWQLQNRTTTLHNNVTSTTNEVAQTNEPPTKYETIAVSHSTPVSIEIPSTNITATFEDPVGVDDTGAVGVPNGYETVAYYKNGPLPGEIGPSVVLGHVDSKDGPAVFYSLGQVSVGDEILIHREDDSVLVFTITDFERIEQKTFPTERVYGYIPYQGLRLVTCSGTYNREVMRYSHNLIVYATLTSYTPPQ